MRTRYDKTIFSRMQLYGHIFVIVYRNKSMLFSWVTVSGHSSITVIEMCVFCVTSMYYESLYHITT